MDTDDTNNPLSRLVIDTNELDRARLAEMLEGYCGISKEGQIRPMADFAQLDATSKILSVLLAKKAAQVLNYSDTDQLSPKEIESITGVPGGTIRFKLMELRQNRLVDGENGRYSVPNHAVLKISLKVGHRLTKGTGLSKTKGYSRRTEVDSPELIKLMGMDQAQVGEKRLNLLLSPGKYLERSLAVLSIAREMGIDALSPNEIARFLKEKIRVSVKRENISLALGRGIRFVDRFDSKTGGYRYRIMAAGDGLLEETIENLKPLEKESKDG